MSGYVVVAGFERSREMFDGVVSGLAGEQTAAMTHGQVEGWLQEHGMPVLRQLFQDHADARAARERRREGVVGADAVARTRVEPGHARRLTTVFGPITVERMAYRALGARNLHPADAEWNMPAGWASHGVAKLAVIESARGSFDEAKAAIERATGARIGKRQLEERVGCAAVDVADFYAGRLPAAAGADKLLVLTYDATGVTMRPEALREATAKALADTGKAAARLTPPERGNRMRMAEIAAVYDIDPEPRVPADIIARRPADDQAAGDERRRPKAEGKWLTGSIADPAATVIAAAFDEADRRDPDRRRTRVVLIDGNHHQIEVTHAEARKRNIKPRILIDFIHVIEYVWAAARVFFRDRSPADADIWVRDRLTAILEGDATEVATGLRRRATTDNLRGNDRKTIDTTAAYLANKPAYLRYDQALADGWPIATGVIDGACRHLLGDRLGITGARWGLNGAEAILLLRAVHSNSDLDAYWDFHLRKERERNHTAKYRQPQGEWKLAG